MTVKEIIESEKYVSKQLQALSRYRDQEDVREYVKKLRENASTPYTAYVIDRYFYKLPVKNPGKNGIDKLGVARMQYDETLK